MNLEQSTPKYFKLNTSSTSYALLTNSVDNLSRIWTSPSLDSQTQINFYLSIIVDTTDYQLLSSSSNNGKDNFIHRLHWLNVSDAKIAISHQASSENKFLKKGKGSQNHRSNKRMKDILKDYSDIVYTVSPDGSMAFWGIQHLSKSPISIPSIILIMKTHKSLVPKDHKFFLGKTIMYFNHGTNSGIILIIFLVLSLINNNFSFILTK